MKKIIKKIITIIKKPRTIVIKLMRKGYLKVNDRIFTKIIWRSFFDYPIDLEKPKTFNEKIQWLKLYNRDKRLIDLVDKYKVKAIVGNLIGDKYIVKNYQVCDNFDDIDFTTLPNKFVIKCNHDSGGLVICKDKKNFDIKSARKKINASLKRNFYNYSREWQYKNIDKKIIVEEYLEDKNNLSLANYKFFCFNGVVKFLSVSVGLAEHETATVDFFDRDFKHAPFCRSDYPESKKKILKPSQFEEMVKISEKLSADFNFVRVDLYEVNGNIYFSELTFTPCAGFIRFNPKEWDLKIGEMLSLEGIKNEK